MAYAKPGSEFSGAGTVTAVSSLNVSATIAVSKDDKIVVEVMTNGNAGTVTVTDDGGNTYAPIDASPQTSDGETRVGFWADATANNASLQIAANFSTPANYGHIYGRRYSGLVAGAPDAVSAYVRQGPAPGTDCWTTANVTPLAQPCMLYCAHTNSYNDPPTAGTGFAGANHTGAIGFVSAIEDMRLTALTAVPGTWTTASSGVIGFTRAAVFREAPPASTGAEGMLLLLVG